MQLSPLVLVCAASAMTFGIGQALLPTAHAQPAKAAPAPLAQYRILLKSLHTRRTAGGLEITGRIVNAGRRTLIYTSVVPVFTDAAGQETGRGTGYLTAGPLKTGQAAEFRASEPAPPQFAHVEMMFREAGQAVRVESEKQTGNLN